MDFIGKHTLSSYVVAFAFTDYQDGDTLQTDNEMLQVTATCQQKCKFLYFWFLFFAVFSVQL